MPTNLSNLKSKVNTLDIEELVPVPAHLSKLSDVVRNYVVKKDVYNSKVKTMEDKVPDITKLITFTTLKAKINQVKNGIPTITNLAATAVLITKTNEVKNKIPDITNLATTTALISIEKKIPNVSDLAKKA